MAIYAHARAHALVVVCERSLHSLPLSLSCSLPLSLVRLALSVLLACCPAEPEPAAATCMAMHCILAIVLANTN